jgi:transposase
VPGAPLDNNLCEQLLKRSILHRKNSLFYKTENCAYIGDLFMSLIHTCNLQDVNPFEYLTALQQHSSDIFQNPQNWLP